MKKLTAFILAAVLILALTACGGSSQGSNSSEEEDGSSSTGVKTYQTELTTFNNFNDFWDDIKKFNDESEYNVFWETLDLETRQNIFALWKSKDVNMLNYKNYELYYSATVKFTVSTSMIDSVETITSITVYIPFYGLQYIDPDDETEATEIVHMVKHILKSFLPDLSNEKIEEIYTMLELPDKDGLIAFGNGERQTDSAIRKVIFGGEFGSFLSSHYFRDTLYLEFTNPEYV